MVTRDTAWPDGAPCWVDLGVADIARASAFYAGRFGWDIQPGPPEPGGQLFVDPFEVMDVGRMAVAADPGGAVLGIWQARAHIGVGLANEPGTLCWNENHTRRMAGWRSSPTTRAPSSP
jgi:uncharacterized protein